MPRSCPVGEGSSKVARPHASRGSPQNLSPGRLVWRTYPQPLGSTAGAKLPRALHPPPPPPSLVHRNNGTQPAQGASPSAKKVRFAWLQALHQTPTRGEKARTRLRLARTKHRFPLGQAVMASINGEDPSKGSHGTPMAWCNLHHKANSINANNCLPCCKAKIFQ